MGITAEEWREWILSGIGLLGVETLPIADAHGRTLAEEVRARHDLPQWNSSAMDGYALRSADAAQASPAAPVSLAVLGEVLAGSEENPPIPPGAAVRIMTGAPVPDEADAVVPVERTRGDRPDSPWARSAVRLPGPVAAGANIRLRGEDTPAGAVIAERGDALTAARQSALAAAGVAEVRVGVSPRVAVVVTGAELGDPGTALARGRISESNSVLIAGMLRECGLEPVAVRRCGDDAAAVSALLDELSSECDAIVSTGGIGPGSHDAMRIALEAEPGVRQARVAVRPGQPQCSGRLASGPWMFALPGNPVAAAVSFELFVRPALLAVQGRREILRRRIAAVAGAAWRGAEGRLQVLPVTVSRGGSAESDGRHACRPAVDPRGVAHSVGGHGATHGYALVGPERGDVAAGEPVDVMLVEP